MYIITNREKQDTKEVGYCTECGKLILISNLYKIKFHTSNNVFLCKDCLFKLHLQLNNIFEDSFMTDGTNYETIKRVYSDRLGIPKDIADLIKEGKYIAAIKEWRKETTLSLKECKDQVDKWRELFPEYHAQLKRRKEMEKYV